MRTPRAQPCRFASMNSSAVPWNQVAIIRPSSCQTVRSRSQSPASRQTAHDSTSSRIARRESGSLVSTAVDERYPGQWLLTVVAREARFP